MCRNWTLLRGVGDYPIKLRAIPNHSPKDTVSHNVAPTHLQPFMGSSCPAPAGTAARCWAYWDAPAADSGLTAALRMPGQHRIPINN